MCNPLISIIVPVYNVEPYIERCVDSICKQSYSNLEIILVNDGSPDRCGEICDYLAEQDSRIQVIHKSNGGLSSARNAGLDVMNGEYVGFVDSDDWIEPDMYQSLINLIQENAAQIAVCGLQCDYPSGEVQYFNPAYPNTSHVEIFSVNDALKEVTYAEKITNSVCDKLFSRVIFDGIRMKEGIINEDVQIMPKCLERAERIVYTPIPFYHYIMTENSITRGNFKTSRFVEAEVTRERLEYYQRRYPDLVPYAKASFVVVALNLIYHSRSIPECSKLRKELVRETKSMLSSEVFRVMRKNTKIKSYAFRIGTPIYCGLMRIYNCVKKQSVL